MTRMGGALACGLPASVSQSEATQSQPVTLHPQDPDSSSSPSSGNGTHALVEWEDTCFQETLGWVKSVLLKIKGVSSNPKANPNPNPYDKACSAGFKFESPWKGTSMAVVLQYVMLLQPQTQP